MLHASSDLKWGELIAPTIDTPLGSFEHFGIRDAQARLLAGLERDELCPPPELSVDSLSLDQLSDELDSLGGSGWAVKSSVASFLLPAWAASGVESVRLVGVVRSRIATIRSVSEHFHVTHATAERIVDAYLGRLADLATVADLAVVEFSESTPDVVGQVRHLASRLDLEWHDTASEAFDSQMVSHRSTDVGNNEDWQAIVGHRVDASSTTVTATDLTQLRVSPRTTTTLDTHVGCRAVGQIEELWRAATFASVRQPATVEVVRTGTPRTSRRRARIGRIERVEVDDLASVGPELLRLGFLPDGLLVHGLLAGRRPHEVAALFRAAHLATSPFAEMVFDLPNPPCSPATAPAATSATADEIGVVARSTGWEVASTRQLSAGRTVCALRKLMPGDDLARAEAQIAHLTAVIADLTSRLDMLSSASVNDEARLPALGDMDSTLERAERAEAELARLRSRRSVRIALAAARPFRLILSRRSTAPMQPHETQRKPAGRTSRRATDRG